jgi:hypothetical protein
VNYASGSLHFAKVGLRLVALGLPALEAEKLLIWYQWKDMCPRWKRQQLG